MWPAYNAIGAISVISPYTHLTVNYSQNFVEPITGACTNYVEGFWKNAKQKNKQMCGTSENMLSSYLDEFMWRQVNDKKTIEAFDNILLQISTYYPI